MSKDIEYAISVLVLGAIAVYFSRNNRYKMRLLKNKKGKDVDWILKHMFWGGILAILGSCGILLLSIR